MGGVLLFARLAAGPVILTGPVINPANHHAYLLLSESSWPDAESAARSLGGHLATVRNAGEQDWIEAEFGSWGGVHRSLWIGLHRVGNTDQFAWSSGETPAYSHWLPGQPDHAFGTEAYVHLLNAGNEFGHPAGFWNDLDSPGSVFTSFDPICGVVEIQPPAAPELVLTLDPPALCWATEPGVIYQVQAAPNPVSGPWIDSGPVILGDGGRYCQGTGEISRTSNRFFRVLARPGSF